MSIATVVTRGFGPGATGVDFIPTLGFTVGAAVAEEEEEAVSAGGASGVAVAERPRSRPALVDDPTIFIVLLERPVIFRATASFQVSGAAEPAVTETEARIRFRARPLFRATGAPIVVTAPMTVRAFSALVVQGQRFCVVDAEPVTFSLMERKTVEMGQALTFGAPSRESDREAVLRAVRADMEAMQQEEEELRLLGVL
jgi:hypothetical protein